MRIKAQRIRDAIASRRFDASMAKEWSADLLEIPLRCPSGRSSRVQLQKGNKDGPHPHHQSKSEFGPRAKAFFIC